MKPIQTLIKLISPLIALSFHHQNQLGRLDALSGVEVGESSEEGSLLCLHLAPVLGLDDLLVEASLLGLVLAGGVVTPIIAPSGVLVLGGLFMLVLGAVGDEVTGISTPVTAVLRAAPSPIQPVVVKPGEPRDHKRQILITQGLQLLICD